jgi:hypothetical protein
MGLPRRLLDRLRPLAQSPRVHVPLLVQRALLFLLVPFGANLVPAQPSWLALPNFAPLDLLPRVSEWVLRPSQPWPRLHAKAPKSRRA